MNRAILTTIVIGVMCLLGMNDVFGCNSAPTATICGPDPKYVKFGDSIEIDGSCSSDSGGSIVKYEWDFDYDGSTFDLDYYETSSYHPDGSFDGKRAKTYSAAGSYTVMLRVTDNSDPAATDTEPCTVHVVKIVVDVADDYPQWVHVGPDNPLDVGCTVTPAGLGGTYEWVKSIGPMEATMTFLDDYDEEDPCLWVDQRGVYRAMAIYRVGGIMVWNETSSIFAVEVQLFKVSNHTLILDDWPASGGDPRSPKYVFGKTDPIYVAVHHYGPLSDTLELYEDAVKVKSDSDSTGIYLDIKEWPGDNDRTCYNKYAANELLLLDDSSNDNANDDDTIEVEDEEVLTFWLEVPPGSGTYIESNSVMVDRGEFLAVAGTEADGADWQNGHIGDACDWLVTEYRGYDYWNNGYFPGYSYTDSGSMTAGEIAYEQSKIPAWDAGGASGFSCADLLFFAGHSGERALTFADVPKGTPDDPYVFVSWIYYPLLNPNAGSGWNDDVEYCVLNSCNTLGKAGEPDAYIDYFITHFFPKKIHAVLGTCDLVWSSDTDDFYHFMQNLWRGWQVVHAWTDACYVFADTAYGALVRECNLEESLRPYVSDSYALTQDTEAIDVPIRYYYYDDEIDIINPASGPNAVPVREEYDRMKETIGNAMESGTFVEIPVLAVDTDANTFSEVGSGISLDYIDQKGYRTYGANKVAEAKHTTEIGEGSERDYLGSLGFQVPEDYVLHSRGKMMVNRLMPTEEGKHSTSATWCEGEGFDFVREYEGHRVFDDRCRLLVTNNKIRAFSLTQTPLKKTGTVKVRKPQVKLTSSNIGDKNLYSELVYRTEKGTVKPVWQVRSGRYLFHYEVH